MSQSEEIMILGVIAQMDKQAEFKEAQEKFKAIFDDLPAEDKAIMMLAAQYELIKYSETM